MPEVVMPRLSDTMEEGELSKWLKNEGDTIVKGDILAEIETDKATMDLEAFDSGVLEKQLVEAGTVVAIGTPLAIIGDGTGAGSKPRGGKKKAPADEVPVQEAKVQEAPKPASRTEPPVKADAQDQAAVPAAPANPASAASSSGDTSQRPRMSPLARKIAKEHGIDPAAIVGSGPQGRVVRADVEAAISGGNASAESASAPSIGGLRGAASASMPAGEDEVVAVNRIRKVAAKRLTESQAVPHFFLTSVVNVEKLLDFRAELNAVLEPRGSKVSVNDLVVRAAALTLRQHPEANSSWGDDALIRKANVNVGIAVATDSGLLVPVIRDADHKDLEAIARETVALAAKARDGKLSPDEMSGGTFSISNLGMFGIDQFTAVINPPEAAILAVGAASPVPVLRDGALVEVQKLKITLTVDHRVMDGAVAAGFLRDLVSVLEHPLRMLL